MSIVGSALTGAPTVEATRNDDLIRMNPVEGVEGAQSAGPQNLPAAPPAAYAFPLQFTDAAELVSARNAGTVDGKISTEEARGYLESLTDSQRTSALHGLGLDSADGLEDLFRAADAAGDQDGYVSSEELGGELAARGGPLPAQDVPNSALVPETPGSPDAVSPPGGNLILDLTHRAPMPYSTTMLPNEESHAFSSGQGPAEHARVEYADGTHVDIYRPKDSKGPSIEEIAEANSYLPTKLREGVDQIDVEPSDGGSTLAETPYGDRTIHLYPSTGTLSTGELAGVLGHESGHAYINANYSAGTPPWTGYQDAKAQDGTSPSPYAHKSDFEDFSEGVELYLAVKGTPREQAYRDAMPARFAFFDGIFAG